MVKNREQQSAVVDVNNHHNVPGSRGGSDHEMNLSRVGKARHDRFHKNWAANRTPCYLTRLIALHSIGHRERTMDPESIETLFQITTMMNWHRLYVYEAIAPVTLPGAIQRAEQAARYTVTHLTEERLLLRQALHALTNGGTLPSRNSEFLHGLLRFFGVHSARDAAEHMYTEEHHGHLSWVRPMQQDTRESILQTLQRPLVPFDTGSKRDACAVLTRQEGYVSRYLREWDRHLPNRLHDDDCHEHASRRSRRNGRHRRRR